MRTVDGYVAAPRAGDIWEIDLGAWPDTYNAGYTRARVGVVTEHEVAISLCEHTYTKSDDTDNCDRFPVEHAPLSLAQIRALYETDAIDTIHRDGDVEVALEYGGIWFLAVLGLFVVHARRTRRVLGGAP